MLKKILIFLFSVSIVLNIYFIINNYTNTNEKDLTTNLSDSDKYIILSDIYSVKDIDENRKKEIAKDLFEDYLNSHMTDWRTVKEKKLNRKPISTFTDYKIKDVILDKEEKNKFTVNIIYDIQCINDSDMCEAGSGTLSSDNWILGKDFVVDIVKYEDKYFIMNVHH